jgi:hypothetical protein
MSDKIELKEKLVFVDVNLRSAWDEMTDDQRKSLKSELYILNRYISNVKGQPRAIQEHFVTRVNEYFNKHWNLLQKHPKLLWLLLCMCSYDGETKFYHEWIGNKKKSGPGGKRMKFLEEIYPNRKIDELELLADLSTDKEIKDLARQYGMDEATIAKKLK